MKSPKRCYNYIYWSQVLINVCSVQQSKYRVMNKDQWYNVLEFSRTVHADLSNYDEDGACKYNVMFYHENKILKTIENIHLCCITVKNLNFLKVPVVAQW